MKRLAVRARHRNAIFEPGDVERPLPPNDCVQLHIVSPQGTSGASLDGNLRRPALGDRQLMGPLVSKSVFIVKKNGKKKGLAKCLERWRPGQLPFSIEIALQSQPFGPVKQRGNGSGRGRPGVGEQGFTERLTGLSFVGHTIQHDGRLVSQPSHQHGKTPIPGGQPSGDSSRREEMGKRPFDHKFPIQNVAHRRAVISDDQNFGRCGDNAFDQLLRVAAGRRSEENMEKESELRREASVG